MAARYAITRRYERDAAMMMLADGVTPLSHATRGRHDTIKICYCCRARYTVAVAVVATLLPLRRLLRASYGVTLLPAPPPSCFRHAAAILRHVYADTLRHAVFFFFLMLPATLAAMPLMPLVLFRYCHYLLRRY